MAKIPNDPYFSAAPALPLQAPLCRCFFPKHISFPHTQAPSYIPSASSAADTSLLSFCSPEPEFVFPFQTQVLSPYRYILTIPNLSIPPANIHLPVPCQELTQYPLPSSLLISQGSQLPCSLATLLPSLATQLSVPNSHPTTRPS